MTWIIVPFPISRHSHLVPFLISKKEVFSPQLFLLEIEAPEVARAAEPGQFLIIRLTTGGERIPLTIADFDRAHGTVTVVVKVVGKTTEELFALPEGALIQDLVGPLGNPTPITSEGHIVLVGGGLGIAPLYPILRAFVEKGTRTTVIVGFRRSEDIFWQKKFRALTDRLLVATEDGSSGQKGLVVDVLKGLIEGETSIDEVLAIGPVRMMRAVAELTRRFKIRTLASMNPIMLDGIGMCGACRVTVGGKTLFACVDGPDMDAHQVDFAELETRQRHFHQEEQQLLKRYREECALKRSLEPTR